MRDRFCMFLRLAGTVAFVIGVSVPAMTVLAEPVEAPENTKRQTEKDGEGQVPAFPAAYDRLGVSRGDAEAPVVLREFGDYQCPACRRFYQSAYEPLERDYVEPGKVRLVFFDLPLEGQHRHALAAAQAARCAGRQDDYWAMHEALYGNQPEWSRTGDPLPRFAEYAETAGLDGNALIQCIRDDVTLEAVNASAAVARKLGVPSTPFLVLDSLAIQGAIPYEKLKSLIDERLEEADSQ